MPPGGNVSSGGVRAERGIESRNRVRNSWAPWTGRPMKLVTAIVKPFKLEDVKEALTDLGSPA